MQVKAVMTGTPCLCQAATNVAAATEMIGESIVVFCRSWMPAEGFAA